MKSLKHFLAEERILRSPFPGDYDNLDRDTLYETICYYLEENDDRQNLIILDLYDTKSIFKAVEKNNKDGEAWKEILDCLSEDVMTKISEIKDMTEKQDSYLSKKLIKEFKESYKELVEMRKNGEI